MRDVRTLRSHLFFFNDTATTEIYTLSLHDALPICKLLGRPLARMVTNEYNLEAIRPHLNPDSFTEIIPLGHEDRKSTRLNSSHANISYAVFCLKKKYAKLPIPAQRCSMLGGLDYLI